MKTCRKMRWRSRRGRRHNVSTADVVITIWHASQILPVSNIYITKAYNRLPQPSVDAKAYPNSAWMTGRSEWCLCVCMNVCARLCMDVCARPVSPPVHNNFLQTLRSYSANTGITRLQFQFYKRCACARGQPSRLSLALTVSNKRHGCLSSFWSAILFFMTVSIASEVQSNASCSLTRPGLLSL